MPGLLSPNRRRVKIRFSDEEKHNILNEYFSSNLTKSQIWEKYTGQKLEHGHMLRWMRQLGYNFKREIPNFVSSTPENKATMKKKEIENQQSSDEPTFEFLQLQKRVEDLEKQLKEAQMKAVAYSTMIDIAEKELNIKIRKKHDTKPSKP